MTTLVRYEPQERELDLASLSASDYELITGLHGGIRRGDGILICLLADGENDEMFVKKSVSGKYFAAHFPGAAHVDHPIALESDGHRRQKYYWAQAAEANGLQADIEVSVRSPKSGRVYGKLDVAITGGPVPTDIEVQRSKIDPSTVKGRTTKYRNCGYMVAWFNDWGQRPKWLYDVPSIGCTAIPWDLEMPKPRTVYATGLGLIEAIKCVVGAFNRCPGGHSRPCGKPHPKQSPWGGLKIEDVAGLIPAGEIIPMIDRSGQVILVSRASFALYQELTNGLGAWPPLVGKRTTRSSSSQGTLTRGSSAPCLNPAHPEWLRAVPEPIRSAGPGIRTDQSSLGPCARCHETCIRYGALGKPFCEVCAANA